MPRTSNSQMIFKNTFGRLIQPYFKNLCSFINKQHRICIKIEKLIDEIKSEIYTYLDFSQKCKDNAMDKGWLSRTGIINYYVYTHT
jgi:hypothetical protein